MVADDSRNPASSLIAGGVDQLQESLSKDPTLRSIDQVWNANPCARSSRRLGRNHPGVADRLAPLSRETQAQPGPWWISTRTCGARRWRCGRRPDSAGWALRTCPLTMGRLLPHGQAVRRARVAHEPRLSHPQGGLPSRVGLAAEAVRRGRDLDEAERQRINFHLRQFVDAMSPTLMLLSNPAALHKAIETGGASVVGRRRQSD